MRNPYLLDARYKKQYYPQFAGGKYYVALLSGDGYTRLARRIFKRASEAEAYAIRLRGRWMRLYDAAVAAMSTREPTASVSSGSETK